MVHRPFELHGVHLLDYLHRPQKPCPAQARPYVLAATILASSMAFIDYTVIGIAVPSLQAEFAATISDLQWVVNSYALALGSGAGRWRPGRPGRAAARFHCRHRYFHPRFDHGGAFAKCGVPDCCQSAARRGSGFAEIGRAHV